MSGKKDSEEKESDKKEEVVKKKKSDLTDKMRENPWVVSTCVLGALVVLLLILSIPGGMTGNVVSTSDMKTLAYDFFSDKLGDSSADVLSVEEVSDVYKVIFLVEGQSVPLYFTKDGKWISQGTDLQSIIPISPESLGGDITKSDIPVIELFVMTHCPYGTQSEKGFIPVMELLEDVADLKIRFVHYFMHEPEEEETLRQVCIREEQPEKYLDYLKFFLEEGNFAYALEMSAINVGQLNTCISNGKAEEYYQEDSELSQEYGVRGSPTLVINGQIVNSARSPFAYLETVCNAFNNVPEECLETLSSDTPSAMWGWETSGSESQAQC